MENSREGSSGWLVTQIDEYIDDEAHRYAVAIEGAWGSGKTRFIEHELKPHLEKEKNRNLIRISMFGVKSPEEIYERIANALVHLDGTTKSKWKAALKGAARMADATIQKMGIPISFYFDSQLLVNLAISDRHVLVFDDMERRGTKSDKDSDAAIFGTINDFVESRGAKAIIVANSISSEEDGGSFDANIKEKLIWVVLPFKPSPSELLSSVYNIEGDIEGTPIQSIACDAAELARCNNMRTLIRVDKPIQALCSTPTLFDTQIAGSGRISALKDGIRFILLCGMGKEPKPPHRDKQPDFLSAEWTNEYLQETLFEQFSDFHCISEYFATREVHPSVNWDEGIRSYIEKRYPFSQETQQIKEIYASLSDVSNLTDEIVASFIQPYEKALQGGKFSPSVIREALSIHRIFTFLEFNLPFDRETLVQDCKISIGNDPASALEGLQDLDFYFGKIGTSTEREIAEELQTYAKKLRDMRLKDIAANPEMPASARLDQIVQYNHSLLTETEASAIVDAFLQASPNEQNNIRRFFARLFERFQYLSNDPNSIAPWIAEIRDCLKSAPSASKTDALRKKWFISSLDEFLSRIDS